jgi:hypothetical protein
MEKESWKSIISKTLLIIAFIAIGCYFLLSMPRLLKQNNDQKKELNTIQNLKVKNGETVAEFKTNNLGVSEIEGAVLNESETLWYAGYGFSKENYQEKRIYALEKVNEGDIGLDNALIIDSVMIDPLSYCGNSCKDIQITSGLCFYPKGTVVGVVDLKTTPVKVYHAWYINKDSLAFDSIKDIENVKCEDYSD